MLIMAFDEGDVPYYYYMSDTSRTLAMRHELLDSSVGNPDWMRDVPAADDEVWDRNPPAPPMRADYSLGEEGQTGYRTARERWYLGRTGSRLQGTVSQQNEMWDNLMRNFRARSDRMPVTASTTSRDCSCDTDRCHTARPTNSAPIYYD